MNTHKTRGRGIRAIQFKGNNLNEIAAFLEVDISEVAVDCVFGSLRVRADYKSMDVAKDNWIIDGPIDYNVVRNDYFHREYESL